MDKKALEAFSREAAKSIKTESDLDDFRKMLTKVTVETALNAELDEHLGYQKHQPRTSSNSRNGYSGKSIITDDGEVDIDVPRDREASFEPQLVRKHQTRFQSMDDKILSLYAKGMTTREIVATFKEMYDADVSPTLISKVTDSVLEQVIEWQSRSLDEIYPIVYLDCIVVKVRQDKQVINKAVYLALGVNMEGQKELLGMWLSETEGAKFWLNVLTDLKKIYQSATEDEALLALEQFSDRWDSQYPQVSRSWMAHWDNLNTLFNYPEDIRRAIYTTNAIESLNSVIRKAIKKRKLFPTDESARKVIYLAIRDASKKWTMPIRNWRQALNRFMIMFEDRLTEYM
ncbi:TPA: IS256 family transposase [Vibrio parahaemolyticus]|nr:IS256 family transposase [Vibrio parahaemolyticus]HBB9976762.1 IS256 family transposase [Vibrio parahaemolyticus]HBC0013361.1 IS256 family transposase [Vibrio parahaemolyticus]